MLENKKEFKYFEITSDSVNKINDIIRKMENKTMHNHYHIIYDICSSIENHDITYVEIGSYAGGSASLMSSHPNVKKVISIDIGHPVDKNVCIRNVQKFKHQECFYEYIQGDSASPITVGKLRSLINEADILFIDGNHTYNYVISDFNNYKDFVKKGGYIIFDDYMDFEYSPEVHPAVNDIVKNLSPNEYEIIGSLVYEQIKETNIPNFTSSNEFILKKL
jgi:cephalosporin hydroxylase